MLIVQPVGGLCNRLRAIDAASALATELQLGLAVLWFPAPDLNASFHDLFEQPTGIRIIDIRTHVGGRALNRALRALFRPRFKCCYLGQPDIEPMLGSRQLAHRLIQSRHAYLQTYSEFWPVQDAFAMFRPLPDLQARIERYGRDELVGVHIRRTDNVASIQHSPIENFEATMREEIERDPGTRFFVATDDPAMEARLQLGFPGRIVVHEKSSLARSDPRAIRDAVVDLYALSNCRKLIGSYWSSFTDSASRIRGIECCIIGDSSGRHAIEGNRT